MDILKAIADFFVSFTALKPVAIVGIILCILGIVLFYKFGQPSKPKELKIEWDKSDLNWITVDGDNAPFWFLLNQLRVGLPHDSTVSIPAGGPKPPASNNFRLFRGIIQPDSGDKTLSISIKTNKLPASGFRPQCLAFAMRLVKNGYRKIVNLDPGSGFPKGSTKHSDTLDPIVFADLIEDEKIEVVVFVLMHERPDLYPEIKNMTAEQLLDVTLAK